MNPTILRLVLQSLLGSSSSLTPAQSNPALWGSPEEALERPGAADEKKTQMSPVERIKDSFLALKDMHKGSNQTPEAFLTPPLNGPSPFDNAQWPQGPVGAPSSMDNQARMIPSTPLPAPRPPMPSPAPMGFFERSTALQRDPATGEYIDPQAARRADAGVFKGLF